MSRAPLLTVSAVLAWAAVGLLIESRVGPPGQLVLGAATAALLVALLLLHRPPERVQALLVVLVATGAEVVGSLLWGVYEYRLENLPAFVPPGHGLVFLAGLGLARCFGRRAGWLVAAALTGAVGWGAFSLVAFERPDAAGAVGCCVLAAVLARTRMPAYAGVFFAVAALELAGTALGTWAWASTVPGLGIPQANPPSGVASGYVLFDVVAVTVAAWPARLRRRQAAVAGPAPLRSRLPRPVGQGRHFVPEPGTVYTSRPWSKVERTISSRPSPSRSPSDGAAATPIPFPLTR
jgi:hypothetical protein